MELPEEAYRTIIRHEAFGDRLDDAERAILESDPERWARTLRAMITDLEVQFESRKFEIETLRREALNSGEWNTYHDQLEKYEDWRRRATHVKRRLAMRSPQVREIMLQTREDRAAVTARKRAKELRDSMRHILHWLGKAVEEDALTESISAETWDNLVTAWLQFKERDGDV